MSRTRRVSLSSEPENFSNTRRRRRRKEGQERENDLEKRNEKSAQDLSLEDKFGLGNNQLKELLDQELPVPREDLITRKAVDSEKLDTNKVFNLPELGEFVKDVAIKRGEESKTSSPDGNVARKVDRSNQEEYLRVLQLNPFADADETIFLEEYDIFQAIFGSGKLLNIPVPYLQTGHGILGIITLLAAFVYAPGNPLTEFPVEIRSFLKQGLLVTYSVNGVLAALAYQNAKSKNLPALFWAVKCFLLGGVSYYEIMNAKDPSKINDKPMGEQSNRRSVTQKRR